MGSSCARGRPSNLDAIVVGTAPGGATVARGMRGHMAGTGLAFPPLSAFDKVNGELAVNPQELLLSLQGGGRR